MPILQIAVLVALLAGIEGANFLSGGEMYLASVRLLAQDTGMMHSEPPPPPPMSSTPPPTTTTGTQEAPPPPPPSPMPPTTGTIAPHEGDGQMMPPPIHPQPPMPPPMPPQTGSEGQYGSQNQGMMPPPPGARPGMMPGGTQYNGSSEGNQLYYPPMPPRMSREGQYGGSYEGGRMPPPPGSKPGMMPGEAGPRGTQMGAPYQGSRQMMPPPPGARPGMMPGEGGRGGFMESLKRGGETGLEHEIEKSKMMPPPMPPPPAGGQPREGSNKNNQQDNGQKTGSQRQPMVNPFRQFDRQENHEGDKFDGGFDGDFEEHDEDRLDPREVSQVLSEIKRMRGDVKRLQSQAKKSGINGALASELAGIAEDLERLAGVLTGSADNFDKREAIQEFRDGQYHEKLNEIRAKVEVPQEIKKLAKAITRLKKMIGTKSIKNLGVDLGRVNADIAEMEQALQEAQNALNNGDYEDARASLQEFYDGGHPNEIESALFRIKDAKTYLKRIRDAAQRSKMGEVIQEAIRLFNSGEYREAREYLEGQMRNFR